MSHKPDDPDAKIKVQAETIAEMNHVIDHLYAEISNLSKRVNQLEWTVDDWRGNFWALFAGAVCLFLMISFTVFTQGTP